MNPAVNNYQPYNRITRHTWLALSRYKKSEEKHEPKKPLSAV